MLHHDAAIHGNADAMRLGLCRSFFMANTELHPHGIEAEFDHLPFADGQFDLAVFNSSLHYSTDYHGTLGEARRCLKPSGSIVVLVVWFGAQSVAAVEPSIDPAHPE